MTHLLLFFLDVFSIIPFFQYFYVLMQANVEVAGKTLKTKMLKVIYSDRFIVIFSVYPFVAFFSA